MIRLLFLILGLLAVAFAVEGENEVERKKDNSDVGEESSGAIGNELEKRGDKTMPNIGYLFKGYNVLEGNPMDPEKFDPGFRAKIFQASYQQDRLTDDRQFKIPDNVDLDEKEACSSSFSAESVMTESDYQKSLMAKAAVSGSGQVGVVEASFSASTEYTEMSKSLKSNTKSVIKTEATCIVYEARVQTGTPPEFTANFLETVKRLGQDPEGYGRFLDTFGTHFVETVDMGARYARLQVISKSNQEKLSKSGIDVKFAAEASAAGVGSAKAEFQFKVDEEQKKKFEKSVETTKTVTIGSKPPANGDHEAWMQASVENPMPTYYRLKSILEVFRPAFFEDNSVDYRKIRTELSQYLQGYCKRLKKTQFPNVACEGPSKGCAGGTQCSVNAICTDNTNSGDENHLYNCKCKVGYEGDGKLCERKLEWKLTDEIKQEENRGGWGTWGTMDYCESGVLANGFLLRAEKDQGSGDDTGANAVCLQCGNRQKCSNKGPWGDWSDTISCPEGSYLTGWRQNVEDYIGNGDDTALDNVEYRCRDIETWQKTKQIKTKAAEWGRWSRFQECRKGEFICGIKTRVESPGGDDTALNDIIHQCCKPVLNKKRNMKFKYGRRS